ncbi:MAG: flagellar protein FliT [Sterolibacterium sp.]|nr:flagellar protein FliT [Sterolibacterium sp.]
MPAQISLYEEMSTLSTRMVEAARANDWDMLIELERAVAVLRDKLMSEDGNADLSDAEAERKSKLIQHILEDDAEIRRHTEPWMEHVRQFLGAGAKQRQVERAYGAQS